MEYGNTQQYYQQQYKPCYGEEYMYEKERIVYEGAPAPKHHNPTNNNFKRNELLGEASAVATGAFALYEALKASTDPIHAPKHKHEAELAGIVALASTGYAFYEHQQKEKYPNW